MVWLCACGALLPLALALAGADYLAPRNLIAMTIPLTLFVAVVCAAARSGAAGMALIALAAVGFATVSVDVDLSPRLQRGDWSGVAAALGRPAAAGARAIVTVQLGAAPLEYYLRARSGGLRNMPADTASRLSEIDEVGYAPLRASAGGSPAPGFRLLARRDINGLVLYRFTSHSPRALAEAQLRAQRITSARAEVLVGGGAPTRSLAARAVPSKSSIHEKT
jgi:hypothetical protein